MPDLSVIIAAYNTGPYIEKAVRSALDQTHASLEVILVDDASTDNTFNIAQKIEDERLICLKHDANQGPATARNTALSRANGAWIAVLDGDDWMHPARLENLLKTANNQNADIVVDNPVTVHEETQAQAPLFQKIQLQENTLLSLDDFLKHPELGYLKPVFKASFLKEHKLQYDSNLKIGEDYQLIVEALASGAKCVIGPSGGYIYTQRSSSISFRSHSESIEKQIEQLCQFLDRYDLDATSKRLGQKYVSRLKAHMTYEAIIQDIKDKAFGQALKNALSSPQSALMLYQPLLNRICGWKQHLKTF